MTADTLAAAPVVSYLEQTLGLSFSGLRRTRLLASVEQQRAAARLSPDEFVAEVTELGPLFDRLVTEITVGETYFFRDRQQCELLRAVVLPELAASTPPEQRLTMWSAGCASGEEAVTLAVLADEAGIGSRSSIVGSDVCRRALDKAQAGVYGRWSMRSTTEHEQSAHFRRKDGRFTVAEHLRRRTTFVQRNLLDGPPAPGRFQVVLCRNVLIYLTRDAVREVAAVLADSLAPEGWLLTGAGDPPLVAPGLERVRTPSGLAYRRVDSPAFASPVAVPAGTTVRPIGAPEPSVARQRSSTGLRGARAAPTVAAARSVVPQGPAPAGPAPAAAERVRQLGDTGRLTEALAAAEAAAEADPLDVELRYLVGVLLLETGQLEQAAASAAAAVFLGPDEPAAHVLLGQVQHAAGGLERARRSFRNAARLLAATPSELPVALAGGVPAGHLAAVARHYLTMPAAPR